MTSNSQEDAPFSGDLRLQLIPDLTFTPLRAHRGGWVYQIEVPSQDQFFRVGTKEYALISLLDGSLTLAEAYSRARQNTLGEDLSAEECQHISRWLIDSGLVVSPDLKNSHSQRHQRDGQAGIFAGGNPLFSKIPLFGPDPFLRRYNTLFAWMHSPVMVAAWCVACLLALWQISSHSIRFAVESTGIFAPSQWIWLLGVWMVLKILHEFSHAVACRRFGIKVGEAGVLLFFFAPLAYIDVTSSWRLTSRWKRIQIALAGIYIETWVAAIAAILWASMAPGPVSSLLYYTVIVGGAITILFNANPLMRADGYYVLSDLVDIPNLSSVSRQHLQSVVTWFLIGKRIPLLPYPRWKRLLIQVYAPLSGLYRLFIYIVLALGFSKAIGLRAEILVIAVLVGLFFRPAQRIVAQVVEERHNGTLKSTRALAVSTATIVTIVALVFVLAWPQQCSAPGIVEFSPHADIRASTPGFLKSVHVSVGQKVTQGMPLATLINDEVAEEFETLRYEVESSQLRQELLIRQGEMAVAQVEQERLVGLKQQLAEQQREVEQLTLKAPVDGVLVEPDPASLVGVYFERGDSILTIGGQDGKSIKVVVSHIYSDSLKRAKPGELTVHFPGLGKRSGRCEQFTPTATRELHDMKLSAVNGGPIPVRPPSNATDEASPQSHEMFEPQFSATVEIIDPPQDLAVGNIGSVRWRGEARSIGLWFVERVRTFVESKVN
ncbi:site-2 protease family protein [Stratiformator vulcanicus]|uniref:Peptidase family M50 n=1 Tax=Stratiformator vulcanicus TaxID=2527980 RepID=A0A517QW94_9PLAN|nr:site-2 protease family protein [Stratiformator vulcanicus]QDT35911.1 Peptidase family M50 [Stratiformator vulcanicus]